MPLKIEGRRWTLHAAWLIALTLATAQPALALNTADAKHLLLRTGFGATAAEAAALQGKSRAEAVRFLLDGVHTEAVTAPPAWVAGPGPAFPRLGKLPPDARRAARLTINGQGDELKVWWYDEMLATPSPLTERLTLFWHNHFTSSLRKTRAPVLHFRQNALLRREALGSFAVLLGEISRDPVMLDYLDNRANRWRAPNENFARELLELFTLGEGHYTEQDIKEAARALTGWTTGPDRDRFVFNPNVHDPDDKTFLGRTGRFTGDDILRILLEQPRTAEFLVEKLWREFVSPDPDRAEVARIAEGLRRSGYQLKPTLEALLMSDAFWAEANRGELIKSPVELLVGTGRALPYLELRGSDLAPVGRRLGQNVFDPPNVKGWPGHTVWINTDTLLAREQFLRRAVARNLAGDASNASDASNDADASDASQLPHDQCGAIEAELAPLLLARAPVHAARPRAPACVRLRTLFLDPTYQLK